MAREQEQEAKLVEARQQVVTALVKLSGPGGLTIPTTESDLRGRGVGVTYLKKAIASLLKDGTLAPASVMRGNNQKYPGFVLVPSNEE